MPRVGLRACAPTIGAERTCQWKVAANQTDLIGQREFLASRRLRRAGLDHTPVEPRR